MDKAVKFSYIPARFSLGLGAPKTPSTPQTVSNADDELLQLGRQLTAHLDAIKVAAPDLNVSRTTINGAETTIVSEPKPPSIEENGDTTKEQPAAVEEVKIRGPLSDYIELSVEPAATRAVGKSDKTDNKLVSDAELEAIGNKPYWMAKCKNINSPFLRLHQEIVELTELLQPAPEEVEARRAAVEEIRQVVVSIWPTASVTVFGSFATGLYVPTSDVDLVIMDSKCDNIQAGLKALASILGRKNIAKGIQVIGRARVPIIKFETIEHGSLAFDVSFDVANGPQAADLVRQLVKDWPMMRPLVLVLKLFLQQRELNEVYTGGIGSYALITMVAAFLQLHTSRRKGTSSHPQAAKNPTASASKSGSKPGSSNTKKEEQASLLEPSLGVLLVDFFRLFGRVINTNEVGVACGSGGHFFQKHNKNGADWSNDERPYMMAVEDPKDSTNDICRSSYNIMRVKAAFDFAYQQLTAPSLPTESLLARILRLGAILVSRKPTSNPKALYAAVDSLVANPIGSLPAPAPAPVDKSSGKAAAAPTAGSKKRALPAESTASGLSGQPAEKLRRVDSSSGKAAMGSSGKAAGEAKLPHTDSKSEMSSKSSGETVGEDDDDDDDDDDEEVELGAEDDSEGEEVDEAGSSKQQGQGVSKRAARRQRSRARKMESTKAGRARARQAKAKKQQPKEEKKAHKSGNGKANGH